jgi:ribosomal-protein-alanine N-acetyltransferase
MTHQVDLRSFRPEDIDAVWEWASDPEFTRYLTWSTYTRRGDLAAHLDVASRRVGCPDQMWGILCAEVLVGSIHAIRRTEGAVQFGYGVVRQHWGRGIAPAACRGAIQIIEREWPCRELWADVHRDNHRGRAVALRLGFVYAGSVDCSYRERYVYVFKARPGCG